MTPEIQRKLPQTSDPALASGGCSATVVLRSATAWYRPSTELAWIAGYLCQRWYPTSRHTIHHHPEWVVIPEMDKYSQPIEPENRKSPNEKLSDPGTKSYE